MRKIRPHGDSNQQSDSKSDPLSVRLCGLEVDSSLNNRCLFSDTSKYILRAEI